MDEYINRKKTKRELSEWCISLNNPHLLSRDDTMFLLDNIPAADVAPVVYGRWIRPHWKNSNYCCDCSECGGEAMHRDYQWHKNGIYPICPNCGAIMDGGGENGRLDLHGLLELHRAADTDQHRDIAGDLRDGVPSVEGSG